MGGCGMACHVWGGSGRGGLTLWTSRGRRRPPPPPRPGSGKPSPPPPHPQGDTDAPPEGPAYGHPGGAGGRAGEEGGRGGVGGAAASAAAAGPLEVRAISAEPANRDLDPRPSRANDDRRAAESRLADLTKERDRLAAEVTTLERDLGTARKAAGAPAKPPAPTGEGAEGTEGPTVEKAAGGGGGG